MRSRLKEVGSALAGVNRDTKTATSGMSRLIKKITQITFLVYVARRALRAFKQGIIAAINHVENLNLFMVALGENTSRATGFIKEMSESLYLDEARLTRVQGLFYQISESLGLSSEKAYTLSENFTKLALDLASFYNLPSIEDAVIKLQAGLVGETEPLRRIGIIITENNLAETARNLGIRKSIRNMTEMEKIQLRYVTALQQTKNAQGDLARTLEQPENLLRILREQFNVLMRELGNIALSIIEEVIPSVIGLTIALANLARQLARTLGYEPPEIRDDLGGFVKTVAKEADNMEKSTNKTQKNWAKILKYTRDSVTAMTGIDELNILSDDERGFTGMSVDDWFSSADDTKLQIDLDLGDYDNLMKGIGPVFEDIVRQWEDLFTEIGKVFETTKTAFRGLWDEVFGGGDEDGGEGDKLAGLRIMNEIITGILTGLTEMVKLFKDLYNDGLKPILEIVAPDWITGLSEGTEGELAKTVAFLTKAFVAWKAIKISASLIGLLTNLITVGGLIGGPTGLLALFDALSLIKFGIDLTKATSELEKSALYGDMIGAIIAGFGAWGLTGSIKFGAFVFGITLMLRPLQGLKSWIDDNFGGLNKGIYDYINKRPVLARILNVDMEKYAKDLETTWGQENVDKPNFSTSGTPEYDTSALVGKINDKLAISKGEEKSLWRRILAFASVEINAIRMLSELEGTSMSATNIKRAFEKLYISPEVPKRLQHTPKGYAKGGVPEKGNLFIAGEKGPELVTEHNGETVVMNEQQLKERGISFYADGVNIPPLGYTKIRDGEANINGKMVEGLQKSIDRLTESVDKLNNKSFGGATENPSEELGGTSRFDIVNDLHAIGGKVKGIFADFGDKFKGRLADFGAKFKDVSSIVNTTYNGFKNLAQFGVGVVFNAFTDLAKVATGTLLNAFDKFANSKSFRQLFNPEKAPSDGTTTEDQQKAMGDMIGTTLGDGPAGQIFALAQHISDGTVGMFLESAPLMIDAGMDFLENLLIGITENIPTIVQALPKVLMKIIETVVEILTNKDAINMIIESLVLIVASIVQALPDIIFALVDAIPDIVMTLIKVFIENIPLFLKLGLAIGVAILEGLANLLIGGINAIIDGINWLIPGTRWDIKRLDKADFSALMPTFADGGFPQQGQLFIAREAGAELVGNIGGSTAVANNDQIVAAVSDGVYRAVSQAMSERGGQRVSLIVDGRRMSEAMDLASKKRGLAFGTGGY
jgi:hypothetical protein